MADMWVEKARLVCKEIFTKGIDYSETDIPVVNMNTNRLVLPLDAQLGCQVHEMDTKVSCKVYRLFVPVMKMDTNMLLLALDAQFRC